MPFKYNMPKNKSKKEKLLVSVFFFFALFSFSEKVEASIITEQPIYSTLSTTTTNSMDIAPDFTGIAGEVGGAYFKTYATTTLTYAVYLIDLTDNIFYLCQATDPAGQEYETYSNALNNPHNLAFDCSRARTYPTLWENAPILTLNSSHTYRLRLFMNTGGGTSNWYKYGDSYGNPYYKLETDPPSYTGETNISSTTPNNSQTIATSSVNTIGAKGYLNSEDLNDYSKLVIHIENSNKAYEQCSNVICAGISSGGISRDFEYPLVIASHFNYSSTTAGLPIGKYYMQTKIIKGSYCFLGLCATTSTVISTSTTFIISTTTKADALKDSANNYLNSITQSGSSFDDCSVTSFNFYVCMSDLIAYAFVPTPDAVSYMINQLHENILTHFPIGYVTDFVSIISTSTVGSLTILEATVPSGVVGTGSHIELDLTGVLDQFLSATTSGFSNATASSTETLFEYTNRYWKYFLYIMLLFYMLRRILGSHIIPDTNKKQ